MLYLDLDQLKVLNDTAGHDAGDGAIQFCASMLEDVLPFKATLARMAAMSFPYYCVIAPSVMQCWWRKVLSMRSVKWRLSGSIFALI